MSPLVSIIIPCRNEEKTIDQVLEALHQQSFPLEDMEIVIADGLSTDGTRKAIHSFSEAHPDLALRLVDNPKQIIPAGLNTAIKASKGEVIVRIDAHSLPNPDYVQRCVDALMQDKAENVGGVWMISPQNNSWVARSIAAAAANPFAVGDAIIASQIKRLMLIPFLTARISGSFLTRLVFLMKTYSRTKITNSTLEFVSLGVASGWIPLSNVPTLPDLRSQPLRSNIGVTASGKHKCSSAIPKLCVGARHYLLYSF